VSQNINLWNNVPNANRSEIVSSKENFEYYYSQLWENLNPENTAIRQISKLNDVNYNGYSDWYIPSIIELNYIAKNVDSLNQSILVTGDDGHRVIETLDSALYWSSTSVCRVTSWNSNNHTLKKYYEIESTSPSINIKSRFVGGEFGLTDNQAFDLSHQICNGQKMLAQNLTKDSNNKYGAIVALDRSSSTARLRPVRRIPIVVGCSDLEIIDAYNNYDFTKCRSCTCP
jgi:hypothetical protein